MEGENAIKSIEIDKTVPKRMQIDKNGNKTGSK